MATLSREVFFSGVCFLNRYFEPSGSKRHRQTAYTTCGISVRHIHGKPPKEILRKLSFHSPQARERCTSFRRRKQCQWKSIDLFAACWDVSQTLSTASFLKWSLSPLRGLQVGFILTIYQISQSSFSLPRGRGYGATFVPRRVVYPDTVCLTGEARFSLGSFALIGVCAIFISSTGSILLTSLMSSLL